ncbi:hypothetical protein BJQ89_03469 [Arthrobacter sp. ES1]|nr:hypothetical protein [Arthrobacter sp. ES1]
MAHGLGAGVIGGHAVQSAHGAGGLQAVRIHQVHRIVLDELVEVQGCGIAQRVRAEPAANPGRVVPVAEVVEAGSVVALLARVAPVPQFSAAQRGPCDEAGAAVAEVFLVAEDNAVGVQFHGRGAQVIGDEEADFGGAHGVRFGGAGIGTPTVDGGQAAIVVLDQRHGALDCGDAGAGMEEQFAAFEVDFLGAFQPTCREPFGDFPDAAAFGVVGVMFDVVRLALGAPVNDGGGAEAVAVVPDDRGQVRQRVRVSGGVEPPFRCGDGNAVRVQGRETPVGGGRNPDVLCPRPGGPGVLDLVQVAGDVVVEALREALHRGAVGQAEVPGALYHACRAGPGIGGQQRLVHAAGGLHHLVVGVVAVLSGRRHREPLQDRGGVRRFLGVIQQPGDVACRVPDHLHVPQCLRGGASGGSCGAGELSGGAVVAVDRGDAVAQLDAFLLAAGVGAAARQNKPVAELTIRSGDGDGVHPAGAAVLEHAGGAVRGGSPQRPAEGVIGGDGGVGGGVQGLAAGSGPVRFAVHHCSQPMRNLQRVAVRGEAQGLMPPGRVLVDHQQPARVAGHGRRHRRILAVGEPFHHVVQAVAGHADFRGPARGVVTGLDPVRPRIPALHLPVQRVEEENRLASVHAALAQQPASHVQVHLGDHHPAGIHDGGDVAVVVQRPAAAAFLGRGTAAHLQDGAAHRVHVHGGGSAGVGSRALERAAFGIAGGQGLALQFIVGAGHGVIGVRGGGGPGVGGDLRAGAVGQADSNFPAQRIVAVAHGGSERLQFGVRLVAGRGGVEGLELEDSLLLGIEHHVPGCPPALGGGGLHRHPLGIHVDTAVRAADHRGARVHALLTLDGPAEPVEVLHGHLHLAVLGRAARAVVHQRLARHVNAADRLTPVPESGEVAEGKGAGLYHGASRVGEGRRHGAGEPARVGTQRPGPVCLGGAAVVQCRAVPGRENGEPEGVIARLEGGLVGVGDPPRGHDLVVEVRGGGVAYLVREAEP